MAGVMLTSRGLSIYQNNLGFCMEDCIRMDLRKFIVYFSRFILLLKLSQLWPVRALVSWPVCPSEVSLSLWPNLWVRPLSKQQGQVQHWAVHLTGMCLPSRMRAAFLPLPGLSFPAGSVVPEVGLSTQTLFPALAPCASSDWISVLL